jgi:hypothetical protein
MEIWELENDHRIAGSAFSPGQTAAVQEGVTLKQLFTEAPESRLNGGSTASRGKPTAPKWMRAYGALLHLRRERKKIEEAIASEFEKLEPEDRLRSWIRMRFPPCSTRMQLCLK